MTGEYTFVTPERQNELTRRMQEKLAGAASQRNVNSEAPAQAPPGAPVSPNLAETKPVTPVLQ